MKKDKRKTLPRFRSEKAERNFWQTHDSADYVDLSKARRAVFPELKPTTRSISLRIPETLLARIKTLANKRDIPYQSLMKLMLDERVQEELASSRKRKTG
jgi:predicted DNA binding CopG/RHH family protein